MFVVLWGNGHPELIDRREERVQMNIRMKYIHDDSLLSRLEEQDRSNYI